MTPKPTDMERLNAAAERIEKAVASLMEAIGLSTRPQLHAVSPQDKN